jgi:hypothetical protein
VAVHQWDLKERCICAGSDAALTTHTSTFWAAEPPHLQPQAPSVLQATLQFTFQCFKFLCIIFPILLLSVDPRLAGQGRLFKLQQPTGISYATTAARLLQGSVSRPAPLPPAGPIPRAPYVPPATIPTSTPTPV